MIDHVVSSDLNLSLTYVDAAGVEQTGAVQGDFTIEVSKDGTGNQSTTGITITEIDATNNAGEYQLTVDGTTGFVSAVAYYKIVIFVTASPEDRWTEEIRVSENGTAASSGIAFTATSGDGRVTGDATALLGATVRVKNASDQVIYQTTTDASGLWGTVYLNDSSSYTVHVQATGYTSTTSTITTSGGSATGPGADIDIASASTTTELTASKLWAFARRQAHDKVGTKATTQIKQAVNSALGMLGKVNKWDWLLKRGRINVREFSNVGTVTVTDDSAVVTLSGDVFPSWVAGCEFLYDGTATKISTRDSDTQITLEYAFNGTTAAAQEYTIFQYKYDLPTDCLQVGTLLGGTRFPAGAKYVPMTVLEQERDRLSYGNPDAYLWASTGGKLALWPYPSEDRMINFTYWAKPADLTSDSDEADWDPASISLLYRAIEYHLSLTIGCVDRTSAECLNNFMTELEHHLPNVKSTANNELSMGLGYNAHASTFSTTISTS